MRNALAGNLSPSLTACNTRPRWPCTRWLISALLLLAFCPQALVWELVCWWPLGYWPPITALGDLSPDLSTAWSVGGHLVTDPPITALGDRLPDLSDVWSVGGPLVTDPPITALGDRLPDLSVTWSTCHPASSPRGPVLLTSSTTDDRSDQELSEMYAKGGLKIMVAKGIYLGWVLA